MTNPVDISSASRPAPGTTRLQVLLSGYDYAQIFAFGIIESPTTGSGRSDDILKKLRTSISSYNYAVHGIQNLCGNMSLLVQNIPFKLLRHFCIEYALPSFIYGSVSVRKGDKSIKIQLWAHASAGNSSSEFTIRGTRLVSVNARLQESPDARVTGECFYVPFFDGEYGDVIPERGISLRHPSLVRNW